MRTLRLKNTTGSDILLLGFGAQKIAPGTSEDVRAVQETFDTDSQLIAAIDAGDITVMDGPTEVTDPTECHYHRKGEKVMHVVAGTDISVDETDPSNPVVSFTGSAGGVVDHGEDLSSEQTNSTSYVKLKTITLTLPTIGDYIITGFCQVRLPSGQSNKDMCARIDINGSRAGGYSGVLYDNETAQDDRAHAQAVRKITTTVVNQTVDVDFYTRKEGTDGRISDAIAYALEV